MWGWWFINSLLSDLFFDPLDGKTPVPKDAMLKKGEIKRPGQLGDLLRQIVHGVQDSLPAHGASRSVWFDSQCWDPLESDAEADVLKASRRDPARRQAAVSAGTGLACGWAACGPTVEVTDRLDVIEALLEKDEVLLAAQLQAIADMASPLPPVSEGFRAPWLL